MPVAAVTFALIRAKVTTATCIFIASVRWSLLPKKGKSDHSNRHFHGLASVVPFGKRDHTS